MALGTSHWQGLLPDSWPWLTPTDFTPPAPPLAHTCTLHTAWHLECLSSL